MQVNEGLQKKKKFIIKGTETTFFVSKQEAEIIEKGEMRETTCVFMACPSIVEALASAQMNEAAVGCFFCFFCSYSLVNHPIYCRKRLLCMTDPKALKNNILSSALDIEKTPSFHLGLSCVIPER